MKTIVKLFVLAGFLLATKQTIAQTDNEKRWPYMDTIPPPNTIIPQPVPMPKQKDTGNPVPMPKNKNTGNPVPMPTQPNPVVPQPTPQKDSIR